MEQYNTIPNNEINYAILYSFPFEEYEEKPIVYPVMTGNETQEEIDQIQQATINYTPRKKNTKVHGVGTNDAPYPVYIKLDSGKVFFCQIYLVWSRMLERVFSESFLARRASYRGCTVAEEWFSFMTFRKWCLENGWKVGLELDKDLLHKGFDTHKRYSPETCVFIPSWLNMFMVERSKTNGLPLGVMHSGKKYIAQCNNPFTKHQEYLGTFDSPYQAHTAYQDKKHLHACNLAIMTRDLDIKIKQALLRKYHRPKPDISAIYDKFTEQEIEQAFDHLREFSKRNRVTKMIEPNDE